MYVHAIGYWSVSTVKPLCSDQTDETYLNKETCLISGMFFIWMFHWIGSYVFDSCNVIIYEAENIELGLR
jgi:hypothetical protein